MENWKIEKSLDVNNLQSNEKRVSRSAESPFFHPIFRHWKIGKTEGETMWKIVRAQPRKSWRSAPGWDTHRRSSMAASCVPTTPMPSATPSRRIPAKDEPLAYCADCHDWTPMQWLPKAERGKKAEQWFRCEYCGGRKLTLKYLSMNGVMRREAH